MILKLSLILLASFTVHSQECDTTYKLKRLVFNHNKVYSNNTISIAYDSDFYLYNKIQSCIIDSSQNLLGDNNTMDTMRTLKPASIRYILYQNGKVLKEVTLTNSEDCILFQIFRNCMYEEFKTQDSTFTKFVPPYVIRDFTRTFPEKIEDSDFLNFAEKFRNDSCGCKQFRKKDNIEEFILGELLNIYTYFSVIKVNIGNPDTIVRYPEHEKRIDLIYYYQSECKDGKIIEGTTRKWIQINYNTECHGIRNVEWHSE